MTRDEITKAVNAVWDEIENGDPNISTERLIAMTAERMTTCYGIAMDSSDVCDHLCNDEEGVS